METFLAVLGYIWVPLSVSVASVFVAAFFAAAETVVVFSNKQLLRERSESGNGGATKLLALMENRDLLHATLLLAESFFMILAVVLGTVVAVELLAWTAFAAALSAFLMTLMIVFIVKLAPKGFACKNPENIALAITPILGLTVTVLSPLSRLMVRSADFLAGHASGGMSCAAVVTEEDIKAMINLGEERGSLKEEEKELLHKVFEFGDTLASQSMRPRTEIVSIAAGATLKEVLDLVSEFGYSRYPVIEETVDTVIGILYIKDILVAMSSGEVSRESGIMEYIRPAYFIPENKRVSELLAEMQRDRFQLAIVIDEYGGTSGLVTLEDLIEEIVGSIHDELEAEEKDVQIVDEKNFVVSGQSNLDEVNELLGSTLLSTDFNTLGGFVFGLFGRMPRVGEQLKYKNLKLEVLELEGRKITKIKITKL